MKIRLVVKGITKIVFPGKTEKPPIPPEQLVQEDSNGHWIRSYDREGNKTGYIAGYVPGPQAPAIIMSLSVHRGQERRGYGSALVHAFCEWAWDQGAKEVIGEFLPPTGGERVARKFYQKLGFEVDIRNRTIWKELDSGH